MKNTTVSLSVNFDGFSWIRRVVSIGTMGAAAFVLNAQASVPEGLARPTRPSRLPEKLPVPDGAPIVRTMMTQFANADLFDTSSEKKLPRAEKWKCVRGPDFEIFDQSQMLEVEKFGTAFGNYTHIYQRMLWPFALPPGYKVEIVALDQYDSDRMKLPPFLNTAPGRASTYDHMMVLPGFIRYERASNYSGMGWGMRLAYHGGGHGHYDHHYYGDFAHSGADHWGRFGGYQSGYYDPFAGIRRRISDRDWETDLQNASRGYNVAVIARSREYDGHVMNYGLGQFLLTQRMNKNGLRSSIYDYSAFKTGKAWQYELVPLEKLMSVNSALGFMDAPRRSTSFIFAHLCLGSLDNGRKWSSAYMTLLAKTAGVRRITEPMFRECFGMGFSEMDALLAAHARSLQQTPKIWSTDYTYSQPARQVAAGWATDAEVGRVKARLFMEAAKRANTDSKLRGEHVRNARLEILARFKRGTADAKLLETAGDWEFAFGDIARGKRYYILAAGAGVQSSNVYLTIAGWMMEGLSAGEGGRLDSRQTVTVVSMLKKGMDVAPFRKEFFEKLVTALECSTVDFVPDVEQSLVRAARLFPHEHDLIYRMARLVAHRGTREGAGELIDLGLRSTYRPDVLARFETMRARGGAVLGKSPQLSQVASR